MAMMNEKELQEIFDTAMEVAKKAGEIIKEAFFKEKTVSLKACEVDLVTETDQAIEKLVHEMIMAKFPKHKFIGEETSAETGQKNELTDEPTWIIDPIDGTTNFVHSIPETCFSLGVTVNKLPVVGIVYVPIKDELYTAKRNQGAFLNGKRLQANSTKELSKSIGIMEGGSQREPEIVKSKISNIHAVIMNCHGMRSYGSAAVNLCNVASGRGDFYVEYGLHVWDYAGGALIAEEAGATLMDPTTGGAMDLMRRRVLCACTKELALQIPTIMTHIDFGTD